MTPADLRVCKGERVGTTVVIVDDDGGFRARARLLLEAGGFVVSGEAADGGTGRTVVERLRPQVVLVDVQLPDCDGLDLTRQLADRPGSPAILLVSARDRDDYGPRIQRSGARGFVNKADLTASAVRALLRER